MTRVKGRSRLLNSCCTALSTLAMAQLALGPAFAAGNDANTASPIKHVIVIIGENRSFDHVFATYKQEKSGETISNLLSKGIIKLDANNNAIPGPNFALAHQVAATDNGNTDSFLLSPPTTPFPNDTLPAPLVGGPTTSYLPIKCAAGTPPSQCSASITLAQQSEPGLSPNFYQYLLTGGTGQTSQTPDQRIPNVNALPAGPFQLTSATMPYDSYTASPVHRFYQMWQQLNCNATVSDQVNPSGCNAGLFAWVETTVGAGANGEAPPTNFSTEYSPGAVTTGEGSTALASTMCKRVT